MWEDIEANGVDAVEANTYIMNCKISILSKGGDSSVEFINICGLSINVAKFEYDLEKYYITITKTISTDDVKAEIKGYGFTGTEFSL